MRRGTAQGADLPSAVSACPNQLRMRHLPGCYRRLGAVRGRRSLSAEPERRRGGQWQSPGLCIICNRAAERGGGHAGKHE